MHHIPLGWYYEKERKSWESETERKGGCCFLILFIPEKLHHSFMLHVDHRVPPVREQLLRGFYFLFPRARTPEGKSGHTATPTGGGRQLAALLLLTGSSAPGQSDKRAIRQWRRHERP